MNREELRKALRCCREDGCEDCPLQVDICDQLYIDTEIIPTELLDLIENELSDIK